MTAILPSSLQCRLTASSMNGQVMRPRHSFQSETGPDITRRKGTVKRSMMTLTFKLTTSQMSQLEAFIDDECGGGTLPFLMRDPVGRQQVTAHIVGEEYERTRNGSGWLYSFPVMVVS